MHGDRSDIYADLLDDVPAVEHGLAYGSGVFHQPGLYSKHHTRVLDFILIVKDASAWHTKNIAENPGHYSLISACGGPAVRWVSRGLGVGVHFNTLVPWRDQMIKYGVIERGDALRDLATWDALYLAGRMHKPVLHLRRDPLIMGAQRLNMSAAVAAALCMLPPRFQRHELHTTLCGLSYQGDVRMRFAEDAAKVSRIAEGSSGQLASLYSDDFLQREFAPVGLQSGDGAFRRSDTKRDLETLLSMLPTEVMQRAARLVRVATAPRLEPLAVDARDGAGSMGAADAGLRVPVLPPCTRAEVARAMLATGRHVDVLTQVLRGIVTRSSRRQAVAGLLAAGPLKAAEYVGSKLWKGFRSAWRGGAGV